MSGDLSHTGRALADLGQQLQRKDDLLIRVVEERDAARAEVAVLRARNDGLLIVKNWELLAARAEQAEAEVARLRSVLVELRDYCSPPAAPKAGILLFTIDAALKAGQEGDRGE